MSLFQSSVLKKHLAAQDQDSIASAFETYKSYFLDRTIQENIRSSKEEQFQEGFLRELFVNILGYTINPNPEFNLTTELKNIKDAKKTDGAVLKDGKALAVIELKGTDTKDLNKVTDQAFNYKNNQPECVYVVTSNFEKLRFYVHNAVEHVEFNLFTLTLDQFKLLWLCLQKDNLLMGLPAMVKEESSLEEEKVTNRLYEDYSSFKNDLWNDMVNRNPGHDELLLYKKSQKLLDRFLFIFFAEDKGLLPPNSISQIVRQWAQLKELDAYSPLYDRLKLYFGYMNNGRKSPGKEDIHAYNGGLFKADELLDGLTIDDELLRKHCLKLSEYDFDTEVDTNILGHIFEHSLNEIESVRAKLAGEEVDKSKTKRKRDGVFYTPKYITKYIVDSTVGKLCEEKKQELGISAEAISVGFIKKGGKLSAKGQAFNKLLADYRQWLLDLKIVDPACGSGAFLNQALEFLISEHNYLDSLVLQIQRLMQGGETQISANVRDVQNEILENNLFGVDINEESVGIARLSLWLRTAQQGRALTSLSDNIKCGNSLIDNPDIAGELAFNWKDEFPAVFENGGFDVVIGNPPYVRNELIPEQDKANYSITYKTFTGKSDLYVFFFERANQILRKQGLCGFIVSSKYTKTKYGKVLIDYLQDNTSISCFIDFQDLDVFEGIVAYPSIILYSNSSISNESKKSKLLVVNNENYKEVDNLFRGAVSVSQSDLFNRLGSWKHGATGDGLFHLFKALETKFPALSQVIDKPQVGIKTGSNGSYIFKNDKVPSALSKSILLKDYIVGREVKRYGTAVPKQKILFPYKVSMGGIELIEEASIEPKTLDYLLSKKPLLVKRAVIDKGVLNGTKSWFEFQQIKTDFPFRDRYIIYPDISLGVNFTLVEDLYYDMTCFGIPSDSKSLLAILNSKLIEAYLNSICVKARGGYLRLKSQYVLRIPLPAHFESERLTESASQIIALNTELSKIVRSLCDLIVSRFPEIEISANLQDWPELDFKGFLAELKKKKVKLSLEEEADWLAYFNKKKAEVNALQAQIDSIDKQIDHLVYDLYGLSEEEVRVVEHAQ